MPDDDADQADGTGTVRRRVRRVVRGGGRAITEVEGPQRARVRSNAEDTARPAPPAPFDDADDDTALLDASGRQVDAATARSGRPLPPGSLGDDAPPPIVALAEAVRDYLDAVDRDGSDAAAALRRRSRLRDTLAYVDQLGDEPPRR